MYYIMYVRFFLSVFWRKLKASCPKIVNVIKGVVLIDLVLYVILRDEPLFKLAVCALRYV